MTLDDFTLFFTTPFLALFFVLFFAFDFVLRGAMVADDNRYQEIWRERLTEYARIFQTVVIRDADGGRNRAQRSRQISQFGNLGGSRVLFCTAAKEFKIKGKTEK